MKKFVFVGALALAVLGLGVSVTPAFADQPILLNLIDLAGGPAPGTAKLHYNPEGLHVQVKTTGLTPGDVVTMWFQAFHPNPAGGFIFTCDASADGTIINPNGKASYQGFLRAGQIPCVNGDTTQVFNPDEDSLVLVIRDHGPVIPELLYEMLTNPNGGCKLATNTDEENEGLNNCADKQIAIYIHP